VTTVPQLSDNSGKRSALSVLCHPVWWSLSELGRQWRVRLVRQRAWTGSPQWSPSRPVLLPPGAPPGTSCPSLSSHPARRWAGQPRMRAGEWRRTYLQPPRAVGVSWWQTRSGTAL